MRFALTPILFFAFAPSALAAQSHDPAKFKGTYDIDCVASAVNVHLGVAAIVGASSGSWTGGVTVDLTCDEIASGDEVWTQVYDDTQADCPAWVGHELCDEFSTGVADLFMDVNNGGLGILPTYATTSPNTTNWLSKALGLYSMPTTQYAPDATYSLTYLLDNRDGYTGNILSVAFGAGLPDPTLSCVLLGAGIVEGNIDPAAAYTVDADFLVDYELVCGAGRDGNLLVVTLGFAWGGTVDGQKR